MSVMKLACWFFLVGDLCMVVGTLLLILQQISSESMLKETLSAFKSLSEYLTASHQKPCEV